MPAMSLLLAGGAIRRRTHYPPPNRDPLALTKRAPSLRPKGMGRARRRRRSTPYLWSSGNAEASVPRVASTVERSGSTRVMTPPAISTTRTAPSASATGPSGERSPVATTRSLAGSTTHPRRRLSSSATVVRPPPRCGQPGTVRSAGPSASGSVPAPSGTLRAVFSGAWLLRDDVRGCARRKVWRRVRRGWSRRTWRRSS
jgi:hypothetical protein